MHCILSRIVCIRCVFISAYSMACIFKNLAFNVFLREKDLCCLGFGARRPWMYFGGQLFYENACRDHAAYLLGPRVVVWILLIYLLEPYHWACDAHPSATPKHANIPLDSVKTLNQAFSASHTKMCICPQHIIVSWRTTFMETRVKVVRCISS